MLSASYRAVTQQGKQFHTYVQHFCQIEPLALMRAQSIEQHDLLIRVDDIKIAPQKFARHIGIDVIRIEQGDPVAQFSALFLQLLQFGLMLHQQAIVFAPSEEPARPGNNQTAHREQASQGQPLGQVFARKFWVAPMFLHAAQESQLIQGFKQKV
jgi:hypothetical protein